MQTQEPLIIYKNIFVIFKDGEINKTRITRIDTKNKYLVGGYSSILEAQAYLDKYSSEIHKCDFYPAPPEFFPPSLRALWKKHKKKMSIKPVPPNLTTKPKNHAINTINNIYEEPSKEKQENNNSPIIANETPRKLIFKG